MNNTYLHGVATGAQVFAQGCEQAGIQGWP
jgi:hypothetical protein